jgi:hypothetical protein
VVAVGLSTAEGHYAGFGRSSMAQEESLLTPEGSGRNTPCELSWAFRAQFNPAGLNVYASGNGSPVAGVTRGGGAGKIAVWHGDDPAVELSADRSGNARVLSYGANGKFRSAMRGEVGIRVYDDAEKSVVSMFNRSGRGVVGVRNSNGKAILASLTASGGGNGLWQLNDASGTPVVEAGVNNGRGTVRAGPRMRCMPRPSSLVLPDCILGRAGQ